jgi:hypothetical protein
MRADDDLGREEIFTLFSEIIQRGAERFFRQLGPGPATALSRRPAQAQFHRDFVALDHVDERAVVLRTLIEEFGGEVVSSTLCRRIVHLLRLPEAKSDLWLHGILDDLERSGAVTLEKVNATEVIARIEPVGVSLAYELPVASNSGWRMADHAGIDLTPTRIPATAKYRHPENEALVSSGLRRSPQ